MVGLIGLNHNNLNWEILSIYFSAVSDRCYRFQILMIYKRPGFQMQVAGSVLFKVLCLYLSMIILRVLEYLPALMR